MAANLLFSFDDLSRKDKAVRDVEKYFRRAGANPVSVDVDSRIKRTSGVSYREIGLTFSDSQVVKLRVKRPGDIFQVLLNRKVVPMANQDDHVKAIGEIVQAMDRGRTAFQRRLSRARVELPKRMKTAAPRMEKRLEAKRDALRDAVDDARQQLAELRPAS
ncbi:defense against restriction DarA-related protein [Halomonas sp. E14]|uniref:defense against restriction DarA-related protein n=1 Tax=Halomonas sp. E14 TaxID=3397245 RepID=UPI00403E51A4